MPARARADFKGKLFVVTGASSGLGREIARRLACHEGANIVVSARRRERLEELKAEVEGRCGSHVSIVTADLADPADAESLHRWATAHGEVYGLVNCAGVTYYGRTLDAPAGTSERILAVNLFAGMRLVMLFLPDFLERGSGAILTVTSLAGLLTTPYQTAYSASKHGMQAFMEGLGREYRGRGVTFSTFLPGGMDTEMLSLSGLDKKVPTGNAVRMSAARAARIAVRAMKSGRERCVPGITNKLLLLVARFVPRSVVEGSAVRLYDPGEPARSPTPRGRP